MVNKNSETLRNRKSASRKTSNSRKRSTLRKTSNSRKRSRNTSNRKKSVQRQSVSTAWLLAL